MRRSRPIRPISERQALRVTQQEISRRTVRQRARGRCEFPGCTKHGEHWCHGFGRGHLIAAPLCDSVALTWWGCQDHHDVYDGRRQPGKGEEQQIDMLRWRLINFAVRDLGLADHELPDSLSPIDAARHIERLWKLRQ